MILLIDLCYREGSLGFDEYVLPIAHIIERAGFETSSVHFRSVSPGYLRDAGAVILCGTPLADNAFLEEPGALSWVKRVGIPVLGVCAGMEVVCTIFGGVIGPCIEIGMTEIRMTSPDPLLSGKPSFSAYELHTFGCTDPGLLEILAVSDRCIQVVRDPARPVYGVMFHPEVRNEWVVERFLSLARKERFNP